MVEFLWDSLEFGKEEAVIQKYKIDYEAYPDKLFNFTKTKIKKTKKNKIDDDGWTTIDSLNKDEEILKSIGLLPK